MAQVVALDKDSVQKQKVAAQNAQLAEFGQKIKDMFKTADTNGRGTISRGVLATMFQELDNRWSKDDLDEVFNLLDTGSGFINYGEFVDWFMEENDPKLRAQLLEDLQEAFPDDGPEPDDKDEGINQDQMESENSAGALNVDMDKMISPALWRKVVQCLDLDDDEGQEIYEHLEHGATERGEDASRGFPTKLFLEEMKIEADDREGVESFSKALEEGQKRLDSGQPDPPRLGARGVMLTMFNKVVKYINKNELAPEEVFGLVVDGKVPMSRAEKRLFANEWQSKDAEFIEKVKQFDVEAPLVNATAGQTLCNQLCEAEVDRIIKNFQDNGTKFTDPEWNFKKASAEALYVDKQRPGWDCTVAPPGGFKRLTEIVKNSGSSTGKALGGLFGGFSSGGAKPAAKKPVLFKGSAGAGDIVQGQIGTCFLLGAMGAVAAHSESAIQNMFIKYDIDAGVYGIRFCVDGEWTYVIIDDIMPVDQSGNLMYAACKDPQEVWVPLLEKAYCKLHTCYEMCDGGQANEAIFTFFGGVNGRFMVKSKYKRDPGQYFKLLRNAREKGWLLTTGFNPKKGAGDSAGKCGEHVSATGLVGGHAYSVLKVVEAHGNQLVCCRNPWGSGEWTGKWSDDNAFGEWTDEMKKATGFTGLADGKFWMSIKDFVQNTAGVDYARTFGPNWKKVTHYKKFQQMRMTGTAIDTFASRKKDELSFSKGDVIEVTSFANDWWEGKLRGKSGAFPGELVTINERPVARFDLVGTKNEGVKGPMTVVVMLMQPNSMMRRRWKKRRQDGMNYKDTSYAKVQLFIVGPDKSLAMKKEGKKRCVWGELSLPGGGLWHIYALSADGQGSEFSVRCYVKDGIVSLKDVPGASLSELNAYL